MENGAPASRGPVTGPTDGRPVSALLMHTWAPFFAAMEHFDGEGGFHNHE